MVNNLHRRHLTMRQSGPPASGNWYRFAENKAEGVTKIYIYDEIGFWGKSAQDLVDELKEVNTSHIHLHINSPGGELFDGLAIYNAFKQHESHVITFVDALAASAASFIAMAGDEVVMARNATMMIHDGLAITFGNESDHLNTAGILSKMSNNIADMYFQKAGGSVSEWRALMQEETWFSSSEAFEAGLVDTVLDADDDDAEKETNKWNLAAVFAYAGRDEAPSPKLVRERLKVTNRAEEGSMAKGTGLKATTEESGTSGPATPGVESDNPPTTPATEPPAPESGSPEGESEEDSGQTEEGQETQSSNPAGPENHSQLLVNGARTTDYRAVQAHISSLERFRDETVEQSRRDYVTNLARDNKIPATMIDSLTAHALSLSDEQYTAWSAAYDAAPAASLFDAHGTTPDDRNGPGNTVTDRINVLEATISQHRRGGMSDEAIKNTKSYKELEELRAQKG